jgi:hypothetical protein
VPKKRNVLECAHVLPPPAVAHLRVLLAKCEVVTRRHAHKHAACSPEGGSCTAACSNTCCRHRRPQRLPRHLQQQPLLRVHQECLCLWQAKGSGIKASCVTDKAAEACLQLRHLLRRLHNVPPAVRDAGDAVGSCMQRHTAVLSARQPI